MHTLQKKNEILKFLIFGQILTWDMSRFFFNKNPRTFRMASYSILIKGDTDMSLDFEVISKMILNHQVDAGLSTNSHQRLTFHRWT